MNGEGRALIRSGHLVDGLALLDEAMVTVLDGQLAPFISGTLYCHTIAACHEVADVRRMTRWTDLAERWLTTFPAAVLFGGLCRSTPGFCCSVANGTRPNRLRCGSWWTSTPAGSTMPRKPGTPLPRRAGCGATRAPPTRTTRRTPAGGTRNRDGRCCSSGRVTPRGPPRRCARPSRQSAPTLCPAPRSVRRWWRSRSPRDAWTTRWPPLPSSRRRRRRTRPRDWRRWCRGTWRGAAGRGSGRGSSPGAARGLSALARTGRSVRRRRYVSGSPMPTGRSVTRSPPPRRSSVQRPCLSGWACTRRRGNRPRRLTLRECEVLALVADGRSNRQIGEALYISDRTVARHLTNIFHKIGVTSRTQAARYAIDRGMTTAPRGRRPYAQPRRATAAVGQSRRCRRRAARPSVPVEAPNSGANTRE